MILKAFLSSPALRVAAGFGMAGVMFAVANLILARVLPAEEYGLISLVIGIVTVASQVAPAGFDQYITRRKLHLGAGLRPATLAACLVAGVIAAVIAIAIYHLSLLLAACTLATTASVGITLATGAHFQSQRRFGISVTLNQASNGLLVPVALLTAAFGAATATVPALLLAVTAVAAAAWGWSWTLRNDDGRDALVGAREAWRDALSLASVTAASGIFMQLERLVLPATVGLRDLATFGVLSSLVGSPFRIIQAAIVYTITPGLQDAKSKRQRRLLLLREGVLIGVVIGAGSVAIWFLAPPLARVLLNGRYNLTPALMAATLISGVLKIFSAAGFALVNALASQRGLRILSLSSWVCVAIAVVASFALASYGLVGVIYAVAFGWLLRCLVAFSIATPHLLGDN
jgi:O-antigen/teichoic acid export membrane protein